MGQKVNPHGLRVGIIKDWSSTWYSNKKEYSDNLVEDYEIRKYLKNLLKPAGINNIGISRKGNLVKVDIYTAKPGMIIGKGGAAIEELKNKLSKKFSKEISLNIVEVKDVDLAAQLVAENIALQLEKRISFRKAMKQAMQIPYRPILPCYVPKRCAKLAIVHSFHLPKPSEHLHLPYH